MDEPGVGQCPDRPEGFGHVWVSWKEDDRKPCRFCGCPGRDNRMRVDPKTKLPEAGGFLAEASGARADLFNTLKAPESAHGRAKAK